MSLCRFTHRFNSWPVIMFALPCPFVNFRGNSRVPSCLDRFVSFPLPDGIWGLQTGWKPFFGGGVKGRVTFQHGDSHPVAL